MYVSRNPPASLMRNEIMTGVYHSQRFILLVCPSIVLGRWQLGIDEFILLFFTPKETDVSHFHKVYDSFRLMNLIKINEYRQTEGSLFTEIAFCTFLHTSGSFFLPFFPSLFFFFFFSTSFLFFFLVLASSPPPHLVSFSFLVYYQPTYLGFNQQLPSFVIQRSYCAVYFLFPIASSLPHYQPGPDIHTHGILTIWRVPSA